MAGQLDRIATPVETAAPVRRATPAGGQPGPVALLRLQAAAGNQATTMLLQRMESAPAVRRDVDMTTVRRDTKLTAEQVAQYGDMGDMGEYTKRKAPIASVSEGGINEALAVLPREADGSLSADAIAAIEAFEKGAWDTNYGKWMDQKMADPKKKKTLCCFVESDASYRKRIAAAAREIMDGTANTVTGKTKDPELQNLVAPNGEADTNVSVKETFTGVSVTLNYNTSDVNAKERTAMIADAVKRIVGAGGALGGGLSFNLPKYGRTISMSADCTGVSVTDYGTRAVFVAPTYVHISSEILGNPNENTEESQGRGDKARLNYLSAQLDPGGVASVVHELGHYCHYRSSASQFHLLGSTTWKNKTAYDLAIGVSGYASGSPREFVAEVFLGLVYGKAFSAPTLEMYRRFGGMPVGAARAVEVVPEAEAEAEADSGMGIGHRAKEVKEDKLEEKRVTVTADTTDT